MPQALFIFMNMRTPPFLISNYFLPVLYLAASSAGYGRVTISRGIPPLPEYNGIFPDVQESRALLFVISLPVVLIQTQHKPMLEDEKHE